MQCLNERYVVQCYKDFGDHWVNVSSFRDIESAKNKLLQLEKERKQYLRYLNQKANYEPRIYTVEDFLEE